MNYSKMWRIHNKLSLQNQQQKNAEGNVTDEFVTT